MKTPIRMRPPTHYISDHSERKGNTGERDDRTILPATLGQAVNTKKKSVSIYSVEQVDQT